MEDIEIINLWKSYDKKLDKNLMLNKKNAEDITKIKVQSFMASMKPIKVFTILLGMLWIGFVGSVIINLLIFAHDKVSPFFLFSASFHVLLTAIALVIYIYQLVLIHQVDISEPIVATQRKLSLLQSSTLWIARMLFLQLPFWTIFWWNEVMFREWNVFQWFIAGSITIAFIFAAIWLFFNIKYENREKKWFRLIFNGKEWTPLIKSLELLNQIDKYNQESAADNENLSSR